MAVEFVYGHWAVMEALRAGRRSIDQLLVAETVEAKGLVAEILATAAEKGVPVRRVPRRIIDDLAQGANHQSMALRTNGYPYASIDDVLALSRQREEKPPPLMLPLGGSIQLD